MQKAAFKTLFGRCAVSEIIGKIAIIERNSGVIFAARKTVRQLRFMRTDADVFSDADLPATYPLATTARNIRQRATHPAEHQARGKTRTFRKTCTQTERR